jgi:hypothetical protein
MLYIDALKDEITLMLAFVGQKHHTLIRKGVPFPSAIKPEQYRARTSFILNGDDLTLTYSGGDGQNYVWLNSVPAEMLQLEVAHEEIKTLCRQNLEAARRKTSIPNIGYLLCKFHNIEFVNAGRWAR